MGKMNVPGQGGSSSNKGGYETFDSGGGPTVPSSQKGEFAHQDSSDGLENYTLNKADMEHGAVPEVPAKVR